MEDGGERHLVQVPRRSLDGTRGEPQLFGPAADRPKARAVGRREEELPDPREAHGAAEVAADHREGSRAAVHLVDLPDEGKAADPTGRLYEPTVLRREGGGPFRRGIVVRLAIGILVELVRAHLLHRRFRGQELVGEVERNSRLPPVVVLSDTPPDCRVEVGVSLGDCPKGARVKAQEPTGRDRLDRGLSWFTREGRDLAEDVAFPQVGEVAPLPILLGEDAKPPFLDGEKGALAVPLPENGLSRDDRNRFEPMEEPAEDGWRKGCERGVKAKEVLEAPVPAVKLQAGPDLGIAGEKLVEGAPVEPKDDRGARRADGGLPPGRRLQESHLAEAVPGPEQAKDTSPPPPPIFTTRAFPDTRTKKASAGSPSRRITAPKGKATGTNFPVTALRDAGERNFRSGRSSRSVRAASTSDGTAALALLVTASIST